MLWRKHEIEVSGNRSGFIQDEAERLLLMFQRLDCRLNPWSALIFGAELSERASNKITASTARALLCKKDPCFRILTARQKTKIAVALARRGMVVYGQAFDLVSCDVSVNLDDENAIDRALPKLRLYEVKSSSRSLKPGFADYFFSFSTAELLVAQSLGDNFRFAFVNIHSGEVLDLSLREVFAKARAIYPSWSIKF